MRVEAVELVNSNGRHFKSWRTFTFEDVFVKNWGRIGADGQFKVTRAENPGVIAARELKEKCRGTGYVLRGSTHTTGALDLPDVVADRFLNGRDTREDRVLLSKLFDDRVDQLVKTLHAPYGPDVPLVWTLTTCDAVNSMDRRAWPVWMQVAAFSSTVAFGERPARTGRSRFMISTAPRKISSVVEDLHRSEQALGLVRSELMCTTGPNVILSASELEVAVPLVANLLGSCDDLTEAVETAAAALT